MSLKDEHSNRLQRNIGRAAARGQYCRDVWNYQRLKKVMLISIVFFATSCSTAKPHGYVDATAWSTNYTEDYIYEFHIQTVSGQETGLEGIQVKEFSKGGIGGHKCCALVPGVGETIRVVWKIGGRNDDEARWKTFSRDVVVTGAMPKPGYGLQSTLILRFFPKHELEAEMLPGDGDFGPQNPRIDRLFFAGPLVMRHKGE